MCVRERERERERGRGKEGKKETPISGCFLGEAEQWWRCSSGVIWWMVENKSNVFLSVCVCVCVCVFVCVCVCVCVFV